MMYVRVLSIKSHHRGSTEILSPLRQLEWWPSLWQTWETFADNIRVIIWKKSEFLRSFPGDSVLKNLSALQEKQVWSRGWEDSLKKESQPTPIFFLEKSHGQWRLSPWGLKIAGCDLATKTTRIRGHISIWRIVHLLGAIILDFILS